MRVLIACEESQAVTIEGRKLGHEVYSCDIVECSGGHPEWHIHQDVIPLLDGDCTFTTQDGKKHSIDGEWDMIIAHPPCTFLTVSGNAHFNIDKYGKKAIQRYKDREKAIEFFYTFVNARCKKKAIENPIGVMSTIYRKPDQIIQPYQFGDPVRKSTCLWLFNLTPLVPTTIVEFEVMHSKGKSGGYSGSAWVVKDEKGKILPYNDPRVKVIRSKTYPGIAKAIAEQWLGECK